MHVCKHVYTSETAGSLAALGVQAVDGVGHLHLSLSGSPQPALNHTVVAESVGSSRWRDLAANLKYMYTRTYTHV